MRYECAATTDTCRIILGDPLVIERLRSRHGAGGVEVFLDATVHEGTGDFVAIDLESDGRYGVVIANLSSDLPPESKRLPCNGNLNVESSKLILGSPEMLATENGAGPALAMEIGPGNYSVDAYLLPPKAEPSQGESSGTVGIILVVVREATGTTADGGLPAGKRTDARSGARNMAIFFAVAAGVAAVLVKAFLWLACRFLTSLFGEIRWIQEVSDFSGTPILIWLIAGPIGGLAIWYLLMIRQRRGLDMQRKKHATSSTLSMQSKDEGTVHPTEDGFEWRLDGYGTERVRWAEIAFAELFKRDLLTTDVVCMNLKLRSGDWFCIHEEVDGFVDVIKAMNKEWALGDEWYGKVVLPPFETCKVVITPPSVATEGKATLDWSQT